MVTLTRKPGVCDVPIGDVGLSVRAGLRGDGAISVTSSSRKKRDKRRFRRRLDLLVGISVAIGS